MKMSSVDSLFAAVLAWSGMALLSWGCGSAGQIGATSGSDGGSGGGAAGALVINTKPEGGALGTGGDAGGGASDATGAAGTSGGVNATCGDTTITPSRAPADILIVLDRSASMNYSIAGDCYCAVGLGGTGANQVCATTAGCIDRWTAVKSAVSQAVGTNTSINWGLEFFAAPSGGSCSVSLAPQVEISPTSAAMVQTQIAGTSPSSFTPTASGINAAILYLQTVNDGNPKAILLATDGEPNCGSAQASTTTDMPNTTAAIQSAAQSGFPVYVVGIGPSFANLDTMAQAGGTTNYYPATSPDQLTAALDKISKIVALTCSFQTPQPPQDVNQVWVYVNKQLVDRSVDNGWTFGATSSDIVLTGTYCANMLAGLASSVQIKQGCTGYIPPLLIP